MLLNYLTTFLRVFLRQKVYSIINVFGLAIGIAAALLIGHYITDELSYDRFHKDAARIYRIDMYWKVNDYDGPDAYTSSLLAAELQKSVPGIESVVRINFWRQTPVRLEDKTLIEDKILLADSNFFNFFSFRLIAGDVNTALRGPNKLVLTKSAALNYFGLESSNVREAIGKILVVGKDQVAMEVTGIAEDAPVNSHFHFNMIASIQMLPDMNWWTSTRGDYTYIKLLPNADISSVEKTFPGIVKLFLEPELIKYMHRSLDDLERQGEKVFLFSQPITGIHLNSHADNEIEVNGNLQYIYLTSLIALGIVLIVCINFINLSTARATIRAKEIGIRKTVGAVRSGIIKQHILESYLFTFLGFVFALAIISLTITPFNLLTGKNLTISSLLQTENVIIAGLLFMLIGLLSGVYPAFYLTRFKPAEVLKGKMNSSFSGAGIRRSLVIIQFVVSIILIISTITIYKQLDLLLKSDLGFNKDNIIYLNAPEKNETKNALMEELQSREEIVSCSYVTNLFTDLYLWTLNQTGTDHWIDFYHSGVDFNSAKTLGIQLLEGRFFSQDYISDSSAVIINETAANILGISNLSQKFTLSSTKNGIIKTHEIIGIMKDLNFQSLKNQIKPMVMSIQSGSKILIRLTPGDVQRKIESTTSIWKKYSDIPFEYGFLDEKIASLYRNEEKLGKISFIFSGMAILIACLGLLGLVTYMASQRTKEIGIRKVMGASVQQITMLLSRDFLRLIVISYLLAVPISWFALSRWLETFAYRIEFDLLIAFIAGVVVFTIALLTVSYQSIKAAMTNPVESLRSE